MKKDASFGRIKGTLSREGSIWMESAFCKQQDGGALLFSDPMEIVKLTSLSGLKLFFQTLDEKLAEGFFLAGWLGYEAGYGFEERLVQASLTDKLVLPVSPLGWFGVYREPERFSAFEVEELFAEDTSLFSCSIDALSALSFNLSEAEYGRKIDMIKEQIAAGNLYQVNFTGRYRFTFNGPAQALFSLLRGSQPSSYTSCINCGERSILSFSPELFFTRQGLIIETMPMKGTAPRGKTEEEDCRLKEGLGQCTKNVAENLMIVDLLRNDLGRICKSGSVEAGELFATETWPTLHQMVSTIRGEQRDDISLYDLFAALFPSGSITGAPKINAMKLIQTLEPDPRGIYTGTIGFITPDRDMVFSVAIRTLDLVGNNGIYGSGGGIVWDSDPQDEYRECQLKAKIISGAGRTMLCDKAEPEPDQKSRLKADLVVDSRDVVPDTEREEQGRACRLKAINLDPHGFGIVRDSDSSQEHQSRDLGGGTLKHVELFESILWCGSYLWLEEHLQRLVSSAISLGFACDRVAAIRKLRGLEEELRYTGIRFKVRLNLSFQGALSVSYVPIEVPDSTAPLRLALAGHRTVSTNRLLCHKTTARERYDHCLSLARKKGYDEVIFLNECDEVTEGAVSTLFIRQGRQLFTPPLQSGLLNGIYRSYMLSTRSFAAEKAITLDDLRAADTIYIANSVRGLRSAIFPSPIC